MAWIESHQEIAEHFKTKRLARLLGVGRATAIGHLHLLWWFAIQHAQEGDLSPFTIDDIAEAVYWEGDSQQLINALSEAGFIDDDLCIHDWHEYAGQLIEKRRKDAERLRNYRERKKGVRGTSTVRPPYVPKTSNVTLNLKPLTRNQEISLPESQGDLEGVQGETAALQPPPAAETPIEPEPAKRNGQGPCGNRYAQVIDAVRALNPEVVIAGDRGRNAKAVKDCDATPEVIAEAYVALWTGDWNDEFLRKRGSLHAVIDNLGGYLANKRGPPPRASPNGKKPISDELRRILEANP